MNIFKIVCTSLKMMINDVYSLRLKNIPFTFFPFTLNYDILSDSCTYIIYIFYLVCSINVNLLHHIF